MRFQDLFLFLHLGRAISYGSYFYNPKTWFSGIILFFFLMATAFMGYVLPFGQMSFWGATVITNLLSPFPSLIEWVSGGHYVYNPTLKRFFLFHFLFPFLVCGFIILHFCKFMVMPLLWTDRKTDKSMVESPSTGSWTRDVTARQKITHPISRLAVPLTTQQINS